MANDLAAGGTLYGPYTPEQIFAGESEIVTGNAVAITAVDKYQVVVLTALGLSEVFDFDGSGAIATPGVALPTQGINCVITAQAAGAGDNCPYYSGGYFNHAALSWPTELDTLAKRKAFFAGSGIQIGEIKN